jgi:hypothetical protein
MLCEFASTKGPIGNTPSQQLDWLAESSRHATAQRRRKLAAFALARSMRSAFAKAPARQSSLSAAAASEDWRQGDSNP